MRFKIKQANSIHCILLLLSLTLQHIELTLSLLAVYPSIFYQQLRILIGHWNPNSECTKAEVPNQEIARSWGEATDFSLFPLDQCFYFMRWGHVHTIFNPKELCIRLISISFMLKILCTLPKGLGRNLLLLLQGF